MLKEMADLLDKDFRQVAIACNPLVEWMKFVDGHGNDLLIDAFLILHQQRTDGARPDDRPRRDRCRRDHHAIDRITVL